MCSVESTKPSRRLCHTTSRTSSAVAVPKRRKYQALPQALPFRPEGNFLAESFMSEVPSPPAGFAIEASAGVSAALMRRKYQALPQALPWRTAEG